MNKCRTVLQSRYFIPLHIDLVWGESIFFSSCQIVAFRPCVLVGCCSVMIRVVPPRTLSRTTKRCLSSLDTWCSSPPPSLWLPCALSSTTSLRSAVMPSSSALVCRGPLDSEWRASASGRWVTPPVNLFLPFLNINGKYCHPKYCCLLLDARTLAPKVQDDKFNACLYDHVLISDWNQWQ